MATTMTVTGHEYRHCDECGTRSLIRVTETETETRTTCKYRGCGTTTTDRK